MWRDSNLGRGFGGRWGDKQGDDRGWGRGQGDDRGWRGGGSSSGWRGGGDGRGNRGWRRGDGRGHRGDISIRGGRGRGGNIQRGGLRLCRFIEQGGHCWYGDNCAYSHDISNSNNQANEGLGDTPEQQREKEDYNS